MNCGGSYSTVVMKGTKVQTLGVLMCVMYKHVYMSVAMDFLLLAGCLGAFSIVLVVSMYLIMA